MQIVFKFIKYLPKAVLKRNSSPSRQKTSHTLQATSRGKDLLKIVNILGKKKKNKWIFFFNARETIQIWQNHLNSEKWNSIQIGFPSLHNTFIRIILISHNFYDIKKNKFGIYEVTLNSSFYRFIIKIYKIRK